MTEKFFPILISGSFFLAFVLIYIGILSYLNMRKKSRELTEKSKQEKPKPADSLKTERREFKRVRLINWPAKIITKDKSIDGATRNITPRGAFIYYFRPHGEDLPLKPHKVVHLIIETPGAASLFISAEVIWSDILSYDENDTLLGVGLHFIEVPNEGLQFLHDFVAVHTNAILKNAILKRTSKPTQMSNGSDEQKSIDWTLKSANDLGLNIK